MPEKHRKMTHLKNHQLLVGDFFLRQPAPAPRQHGENLPGQRPGAKCKADKAHLGGDEMESRGVRPALQSGSQHLRRRSFRSFAPAAECASAKNRPPIEQSF